MVKLFMQGGPFYMSVLSVLLLVVLFLNSYHLSKIPFQIRQISAKTQRERLSRSIGLFALIFGIFCQFLGLFGALTAIKEWGEVEAQMLLDGIQVSFIPTCYGLLIFILSRVLSGKAFKKAELPA